MKPLILVGLVIGSMWMAALATAGETQHTPIAIMDGATTHLFVRGMDGHLYEGSVTGDVFSGWSEIPGGGATPSQPGAIVDSARKIHLYIQGLDHRPWENIKTGGIWSGWTALPNGGKTSSGPSVVQDGNATRLFVRGLDDRVWIVPGTTVSHTSAASLAGLYTLTLSLTQSGCESPYLNGAVSGGGTLRLLVHRNQLLAFGPLTDDLEGVGVGFELIVDGSRLSGTWHSMNTINGYGKGTISGTVSGSTLYLSVSGSGQNFSCQINGSVTAQRVLSLADITDDHSTSTHEVPFLLVK